MIYYVAGVPYSDDLYHSGVKGMKWGVRRYQNLDRTLTPLGKIHYGASKAGKAVGKAAVATGKAVGRAAIATGKEIGSVAKRAGAGIKRKIKSRHKWLMTEDDFKEYTNRLNMEATYSEAKKRANANKASTKFKAFLGSTLEKGANKLVESGMQSFGNEMGKKLAKSKDERKLDALNKKIAVDKAKSEWNNRELARAAEEYKSKADLSNRQAEYMKSILGRSKLKSELSNRDYERGTEEYKSKANLKKAKTEYTKSIMGLERSTREMDKLFGSSNNSKNSGKSNKQKNNTSSGSNNSQSNKTFNNPHRSTGPTKKYKKK